MPTVMKHPTLNNTEVAHLSGDLKEPSWKSPNELLHERVNFDDTIWGFGLAGGAHYQTPLRVTYVKPDSRAQKVHIYPGDVVLKINGVDSTTVTLKEAHQMIMDAGIHLILNVTAPEDEEDSYYWYQDPIIDDVREEEEDEEELVEEDPPVVQKPFSKRSRWGLQWPWKCKRKIIWKESNCYMVPSKYEEKHSDHRKPEVKTDDSIVLDSIYNVKERTNAAEAEGNSNNVENENSEHDNEEIESNGPIDNNDWQDNGEDDENQAYFDKFETGGIPEISKSEKLITNGR